LISQRSIDNFFSNCIAPLCLAGIGSAKDILSMKMYEIRMFDQITRSEEFTNLYAAMNGLKHSN